MKKLRCFAVIGAALAALLFSGCVEPVVFAEVFQLQKGQKLYTKYNLWYDDPQNMSSLNIQQGTFLPIGTEIEPVETRDFGNKIVFKEAATGKQFTINFSAGYRLCTMRDFIAYTFTTETREEQLKGISEAVKQRILRGEVVPGMSQKEVILAFGPPPRARTPDYRNETWFYWRTDAETIRLIFRADKVRSIVLLDDGF